MQPNPRSRQALAGIRSFLDAEESGILQALQRDLGKPPTEAYTSEIATLKGDLRFALGKARFWNRSDSLFSPPILFPTRVRLLREPLGRVLIMSPWNYPLFLSLSPAIYALACGNTVCLKPSEATPAIGSFMAKTLPRYVPEGILSVELGGPSTAKKLLQKPWGLVVFTGGSKTGREVMAQASRTLSPVLLELGGQNPAILYPDANLGQAVRQILWGKTFNAGQTCVAPDHVWVHESLRNPFLESCVRTLEVFYPSVSRLESDAARIISPKQFQKISRQLASMQRAGIKLHRIQEGSPVSRRLVPVLAEGAPNHPLFQDEMFSPILPVHFWSREADLFAILSSRPSPLAIYPFTASSATVRRLAQSCPSGVVCQNQTLAQMYSPRFPFGGVGESGFGRYRGLESRNVFTRTRLVMTRPSWAENRLAYPPYLRPLKALKRWVSMLM